MGYLLEAACCCHMGKIRKNNEDNFLFNGNCLEEENNGLSTPAVMETVLDGEVPFAVFDGMGGINYGETASYTAAAKMKEEVSSDRLVSESGCLQNLCNGLNEAVVARARELGTEYMGSTMVMLCFNARTVYACNLGDSRAYLLRGGKLLQLSEDHVEVREGSKKKKAPLTQHLGIDPELLRIEPHIVKKTLQADDQYLLCSDGLTDMLSDSEIAVIMAQAVSAEACAKLLVESALDHGGRDNVTVIICRIHRTGEGGTVGPGIAWLKGKWFPLLVVLAAAALLLYVGIKHLKSSPPEGSDPEKPVTSDTVAETPEPSVPAPSEPLPTPKPTPITVLPPVAETPESSVPAPSEPLPTPEVTATTLEPVSTPTPVTQITPEPEEDSSETVVKSGPCGNNCKWTLDENGLLTISGSGEMYDFSLGTPPWFDERTGITKIIVQNGITRIGDYAFWNSFGAEKIVIPESVKEIGDNALGSCFNLKDIEVSSDNNAFCVVDGVLFSKDKTRLVLYPIGRNASRYAVPDSVTTIEEDAFEGTELSRITLTPGIHTIGKSAFSTCRNLTFFRVPSGVKEIKSLTFFVCTNLTRIYLPQSIISIDDLAFFGCESLREIYYEGSSQQWESIDFEILDKNELENVRVYYNSWTS